MEKDLEQMVAETPLVEEDAVETPTEEPVEEPVVETPVEEPVEEPAPDYEALNARISELEGQVSEYERQIGTLNSQLAELTEYRNGVENSKKKDLLDKYSSLLGEDVCSAYEAKLDTYSFEEFKKEISVQILDINEEALFNKGETKETITDVDVTRSYSGAARLMSKYFK